MPQNPDKPAATPGAPTPPRGALDDLINLNEDSMVAGSRPAAAEDSLTAHNNQLLESAQVFEQHVEQLTAWKHQLASQMELLRKDGIKVLERQKQLAVDRAALAKEQKATEQQRATFESERQQIEALKRDMQTQKQELDQRSLDLEAATEEFNKLLDQKERYLHEAAEAQKNVEALRNRQEHAGRQLEEFAKKADEMTRLEAEKDRWLGQMREAKATVDQLVQTQQEMLKHQQEIGLRMAEFAAREKAIEEREAQALRQKLVLSDALQEVETQRKGLVEAELKTGQQQREFQTQIAAHQAQVDQLQRQQDELAAQAKEAGQTQAQQARLADEVQSLRARIADLHSQSAKSDAAAAGLRQELAESQQAIAQKEQQLIALQRQLQTAAAQAEALTQAHAQCNQLTAQVAALQKESHDILETKERENADLRRSAAVATESTAVLVQAQAQCRDLSAQLAELSRQADDLHATRSTLEQQTQSLRSQLESQLAEVAHQKQDANEQLAAHAARTAALEQQLQTATDKLAAATTELESFEKIRQDHAALTEQLAVANRQTQTLQTTRAALEAQLAEVQVQLSEQADSTELQNRLAEQKRRYETLVASKQSQVEELQRLVELIQTQGQEAGTGAGDVLDHQRQISHITQQLTEAQRETAALRTARGDLDQAVAELQTKLDAAAGNAADMRHTLDRQEAEHQALITEINRAHQDELAQERASAQRLGEQTASQDDLQAQLEAQLAEYKTGFAARLRELQETYESKLAEERRLVAEQLSAAQTTAVAQPAAAPPVDYEKTIAAWEQRVTELQTERDALLGQRVEWEEARAAGAPASTAANAVLEQAVAELQQRCQQLQAEKAGLERRAARASQQNAATPDAASETVSRQRKILLERIRKQRHRTWSFRETHKRLEAQWTDIAKQRESLKSRGNSLEQVKRLLEKQELVMARKLADHGALKTVAAVGIFVIMILGATFFGVYQFVSPTYRSEAIVSVPATGLIAADPVKIVRSDEAINIAWDNLSKAGYNVQAEREAFAATLPDSLDAQYDRAANRMTIRYIGPTRDGVADVCNKLAAAYAKIATTSADPGASPLLQSAKIESLIAAPAVVPSIPIHDPRMMYFLSWSAVVLFGSLIVVMLMRTYIHRQLREIDCMADEEDLENLKGDMPLDAPAA